MEKLRLKVNSLFIINSIETSIKKLSIFGLATSF